MNREAPSQQKASPLDEATERRLEETIKEIKSGERQRQAREKARLAEANANAGTEKESTAMRWLTKGITALLLLPFKLLSFAGRLGVGVVRKTVDRVAGTNWEQEAKQAKLSVMALDEMGKENLEQYQEEMKARQRKMSEMQLEQEHLKEDIAAQTMKNLGGEGPAKPAPPEEAANTGQPSLDQPAKGVGMMGIPISEISASGMEVPSVDNADMKLLAAVSHAYNQSHDDRFVSNLTSLKDESLYAIKSKDHLLIQSAIQKVLCAKDPLLGGRESVAKTLEGEAAVVRIAANQVISYQLATKLVEKALTSDDPKKFMDEMCQSLEQPGDTNTFFAFIEKEASLQSGYRDEIYKQINNGIKQGHHTDWVWLKNAFKDYEKNLANIAETVRQSKNADSRGLPGAVMEEETLGGENGIEGEQPAPDEGKRENKDEPPEPPKSTPETHKEVNGQRDAEYDTATHGQSPSM